MKRYKKTFDKKHKVTRILLNDYLLVKNLSDTTGLSMCAVLHELITGQVPKTPVPAAQIPMPVTMAMSTSVTTKLTPSAKKSMPVSIAKRRSTPVTMAFSREVKTNDFGQNGHQ